MSASKRSRNAAATVIAAAILSATTAHAWAAPAQPGTTKSEKPASQPGTTKKEPEKSAPASKPEVKEVPEVKEASAPAPVATTNVVQDAPAVEAAPAPAPAPQVQAQQQAAAPAAVPAVQQSAPAPTPVVESPAQETTSYTPVRDQGKEEEVTPVRQAVAEKPTAIEFKTAAYTEDTKDEDEDGQQIVAPARTDEDEEEEQLPDLDDNGEGDPDLGDEVPAVQATAPTADTSVAQGEVAAPAVDAAPVAPVSAGASLASANAGVDVGIQGAETATALSGGVHAGANTYDSTVEFASADAQTIEVSVNDAAPIAVDVPQIEVPQIDVPAEAVAAVDHASTVAADVAAQIESAIPDAGEFSTPLPGGLTAAAWYQGS